MGQNETLKKKISLRSLKSPKFFFRKVKKKIRNIFNGFAWSIFMLLMMKQDKVKGKTAACSKANEAGHEN